MNAMKKANLALLSRVKDNLLTALSCLPVFLQIYHLHNMCEACLFNKVENVIYEYRYVNKIGPRTEPCGTPLMVVFHELCTLPIRTRCSRSERYDLIMLIDRS